MDLHHSWGGAFAVEKNVLFSAQSNKKSVKLGTLPVFYFCHQTPCEKHPSSFSRMRSKGSRFTLGVWGVEGVFAPCCGVYVRSRPQPFATVRNRSQPFATVRNRPRESRLQKGSFLEVSIVAWLRFARQAWHVVTFRAVL